MSVETIERIFWEFGDEPARIKAYVSAPRTYLDAYPLSDEERRMVLAMDLPALSAHGVSPMLTMLAFQEANGGGDLLMFEYLKQLNGGRMINRMRIPGWQFAGLRLAVSLRSGWTGLLRLTGIKKTTY